MKKPTEITINARDVAGRFLPGHPIGTNTRWRNVSGNPAGNTRARRAFEEVFYASLIGEGSPEEAAQLLWKAARNNEPWAIQTLLQRLAPQATTLKLQHEVDNGGFDFSRLSNAELQQLEGILERAAGATPELTGGTLPALPEGIHPDGMADH
jgi:hypothetical protein